ncbi:hypothetical protein DIZ76_015636 [Coccidioides immitis]|nr:hypothetical protein DIZ76_015636 [Coccidioides immitis]
MIAIEHPPPEAEIFAGLNNIIARSTSPQKSYESLKKQESSGPKAQPTPAKPKYQLWPTLKKTVSSSGRSTPDSGKMMRNPFKDGGLSRSHKISVPDLKQLATIDERSLDSRQYPIHERSNSAPGACAGAGIVRTHMIGCVGEACNRNVEQSGESSSPSRRIDKNRTCPVQSQSERHQPLNSSNLRRAAFDDPPEVPPKSPRLALRIPNMPVSSSGGDSSSTPVSGTTGGSQSSRPLEESPWTSSSNLLAQTCSSANQSSSENASTRAASPLGISASPCHKKNRTDGPNRPTAFEFGSEKPAAGVSNHKRGLSHDSVLKWGGQPPRKHAAFEARLDDREVTKQLPGIPIPNVPLGIPVYKALRVLPRTEIEALQKQAHNQAQKFEVLNRCDVKSLSRELRALQKRCDYLRETYNSLRAGRHSLHQRMILYLKSPRVSKFSREGILKQEEALFELDRSIDEWYSKLENAEQRRALVRQKLLEHLAATLVLRESHPEPAGTEKKTHVDNSHNTHNQHKTARKDVESIKIYADAEIQALFANIEKDMERMANSGSPLPHLPAVAYSPDMKASA